MAASSTSAVPSRETPIITCVYDNDAHGAAQALLVLLKRPTPNESPPPNETAVGGEPTAAEGGR